MDATITDSNVISSLEQEEKESNYAHTQNTVVNEAATLFDSILNGEQSVETLADNHPLSMIEETINNFKAEIKTYPTGRLWLQYTIDIIRKFKKNRKDWTMGDES